MLHSVRDGVLKKKKKAIELDRGNLSFLFAPGISPEVILSDE